jgi:hypothetical protein
MSKDTALCGCAVVTLLVHIYRPPPHIKRNLTMKGQNEEKPVLRIRLKNTRLVSKYSSYQRNEHVCKPWT